MADRLIVRGAREHNLKDVSLDLPRDVARGWISSGVVVLAPGAALGRVAAPPAPCLRCGTPGTVDGRLCAPCTGMLRGIRHA